VPENKETESIMLTKKRFQVMIEEFVRAKKVSYMDAIVLLCEENNIEIEDAAKHISPVIKNKLEAEAMNLNLLPRGSQLPI